jgi:hypothetical protein
MAAKDAGLCPSVDEPHCKRSGESRHARYADRVFNAPTFLQLLSGDGDVMLGTYLFPSRVFGDVVMIYRQPEEAFRIIETIPVPETGNAEGNVFITQGGGLFVEPPAGMVRDLDQLNESLYRTQLVFQDKIVDQLNLIICELAVNGVVSEPASAVHLARANRWQDFVAITNPSIGGREIYRERTLDPLLTLLSDPSLITRSMHTRRDVLTRCRDLTCARRLRAVSTALPTFVAAAYSLYSRRLLAEALLDAWIVVELVVTNLWATHLVSQALDATHGRRLRDHRSFTVNVQTEVLRAVGLLDNETYLAFQAARKHRNDLAHGGTVSSEAAEESMTAMRLAITLVTECETAEAFANRGGAW